MTLPDEDVVLTPLAVGLYLRSLADICSLFPQNMRSLILRGIEKRLALLTLNGNIDGDDATAFRHLHEVFLCGLRQADDLREKEI